MLSDRLRICRVVTVPITFETLLHDQMLTIADQHDLTLVCNFAESDTAHYFQAMGDIATWNLNISRQISPLNDLVAIWQLAQYLRNNKFDIVHSSTPKAGLVAMLAGVLARTPNRVHTYTGQVWMTATGLLRTIMRSVDWLIGRAATQLYADSKSQRDGLVAEGLVRDHKIDVIGPGSISGVNLKRFDPTQFAIEDRKLLRDKLGIPQDQTVVAFVGRVVRDKGIVELVTAFEALQRELPITLLLIGPVEVVRDQLPDSVLEFIEHNPNVVRTGFVSDPETYLSISDIFCIPSYREGFGSVAIEAGAMEVPVVGTAVTGLVDAIVDGVTGVLVPAKDVAALQTALHRLITDEKRRGELGEAGRQRAENEFAAETINQLVADAYRTLTD